MNKVVFLLILSLSLTAVPAMAADWYVGASLGMADAGSSLGSESGSGLSLPRGARVVTGYELSYSKIEDPVFMQVFAGLPIYRNLAVELGFFKTNQSDVTETLYETFQASAPQTIVATKQHQTDGLSLGLLGQKPITKSLAALVRLGLVHTRQQLSYSSNQIGLVLDQTGSIIGFTNHVESFHESRSHTGLSAGLGLGWKISRGVQGRAEITGMQLENGHLLMLGLGLEHRF